MHQGVNGKEGVKDSAVGLRKMGERRKGVLKVEGGLVLAPEVLQRLLPDVALVVNGAMQSAGPSKETPTQPPPKQASSEEKLTLQTHNKPAKFKTEPPNSDSRKRWNMFRCNFCPQRFPSRFTLNVHLLSHDTFKSKRRPRIPRSKKRLNHHKKNVKCKHYHITHGIDSPKNYVHVKFYCNICKKLFASRAELYAHKNQHSVHPSLGNLLSLPKYPCPSCSENFEDILEYCSHVRTHGAPVKSYSARKPKSTGTNNVTRALSSDNKEQDSFRTCNKIPANTRSYILKLTDTADSHTAHNNKKENVMPENVTVREESIERCYDKDVSAVSAQMGVYADHANDDAKMELTPVIPQDRDVALAVQSQKETELTSDMNLTANDNANMMPDTLILKEECEDSCDERVSPEATRVSLHVKHETEDEFVLGLVLLESHDVSFEEKSQEKPKMTSDISSTGNNNENMMLGNVTVNTTTERSYDEGASFEPARVDLYAEHEAKDESILHPVLLRPRGVSFEEQSQKEAEQTAGMDYTDHNNAMPDTLTLKEVSEESCCDEGVSIEAVWKSLYAMHEAQYLVPGSVVFQQHDMGYALQSKKDTDLTNAVDPAAHKENEPNTVSVKEEPELIDFDEHVMEEPKDNLFDGIVKEPQEIPIDKVTPEAEDDLVLGTDILQLPDNASTVQIKKETKLLNAVDDPVVHCEKEQDTVIHSEHEQDRMNVKEEPEAVGVIDNVSEEPEDNQLNDIVNEEGRCEKVAHKAARAGLYAEHHIKDELVLGPVLLQRPHVAVVIPNGSETVPGTEYTPTDIYETMETDAVTMRVKRPKERGYTEDVKEGPKVVSSEELNVDDEVKVELVLGSESVDLDEASVAILSGSAYETEALLLENKKNEHSVKMSTHTENEHTTFDNNIQTHLKSNAEWNLFKCTHCGYRSNPERKLQYLLTRHIKEPLKCNRCDYIGCYENSLPSHLMLHTGEKYFKCTHCDYMCREITSLIVHQRQHERSFKCAYCYYPFPCKDELHEHQKKHHSVSPYISHRCRYCEFLSNKNKEYLREHSTSNEADWREAF